MEVGFMVIHYINNRVLHHRNST